MNSINKVLFMALAAVMIVCSSGQSCPKYRFRVFKDTASNMRGLQHVVDQYKAFLGGVDNGDNPGPIKGGQRSINWDGDGVPFNMPGNFFSDSRGANFDAKGKKFAVSNPPRHPVDDRFNSILPKKISEQFRRFSFKRLFTPVKDNVVTVFYNVPGTKRLGKVSGFGAVFTDVDKKITSMRYFDRRGCLIAHVDIPAKDKGLSFGGIVVFDSHGRRIDVVVKVVVKLGDTSVERAANGHVGDVVVMDDFIYGEPSEI